MFIKIVIVKIIPNFAAVFRHIPVAKTGGAQILRAEIKPFEPGQVMLLREEVNLRIFCVTLRINY